MSTAVRTVNPLTPRNKAHWKRNPLAFVRRQIGAQPDEQQCAFLSAVARSDSVAVKSGHGTGKCLSPNTPVMMHDGTIVRADRVAVGDQLMGSDARPRTVRGTGRGTDEMYRVEYRDGTWYDVNSEHLLVLKASQTHGRQRTGDKRIVSVKEYLTWSRRRQQTHVGIRTGYELPMAAQPVEPYLLGVWLGDGNSQNGIIYNTDREIIDYLRATGLVSEGTDKRSGCWFGRVCGLMQHITRLGLKGNKHIPDNYMRASTEQRLELLAGLIDSDGHLDKKSRRQYEITQKSERLACDIVRLARSVGIHAVLRSTWKRATNSLSNGGYYHRVSLSRASVDRIPVRVERKKAVRTGREQRDNLHFGITVRPLGVGEYVGFELDGDGEFLLGDTTITHNTTVFAWLVIWWLCMFEESRVVATAPTQRQLLDVLWPEIQKWLEHAQRVIENSLVRQLEWQATRVNRRGHSKTWFATARTSNKPENMQGFHAEFLLVLVDEASGVRQDTMEAIEGVTTTAGVKMVLGGNPTRISGTFFDAFHKLRAFFETLTLSSERSEHVTKVYCDRLIAKYGADSDVVRVRVKGEFPRAEPDVFISLDLVEAAVLNEGADPSGTISIGCDPARFGDSETVIYWRQGYVVEPPICRSGIDTQWTVGEIARLVRHIHNDLLYEPRIDVMVDETGLGAGVVDPLEQMKDELWINVNPVNFGGTGDDECWDIATLLLWQVREALAYAQLPDDDDTVAQLTTRKYRVMENGKLKIESKDQMKARKLPSPDRADALGLCFHQPLNSVIMTDKTREALRARRGR